MKLLLVNPQEKQALGWSDFQKFRMPPLGLAYIAALTPSDWEIAIADENFEPFEPEDADLVGITAFTCNARRAYEIAATYRERGVPVVMGGMHASALPEEALRYVDSVVVGEADGVWGKVVQDFEAGALQKTYEGPRPSCDALVKPRRDLLDPRYSVGTVQTSRGCPFDCEFCAVSEFFGRTYRLRPVDEVLDELESIPQTDIFFLDDNIVGSGKNSYAHARELFQGMIDRRIRKRWMGAASVNLFDEPELMRLAAESGCMTMVFGIESPDPETLRGMNKGINIGKSASAYKEGFRQLQRLGITSVGAFIMGNDSDTEDTPEQTCRFAEEIGVDVFQFSFLTPLPGTRLYRRIEDAGRLILNDYPEDWRYYTFGSFVFETMLPAEAIMAKLAMFGDKSRTWPSILRSTARNLVRSRSVRSAAVCFTVNRVYRDLYLQGRRAGSQGKSGELLSDRLAEREKACV